MIFKKNINNFVIKLLILFMPLIFIFLSTMSILYLSKEVLRINNILINKMSKNDSFLFGLAYSNQDKYFKNKLVINSKPDIIALGTSRVMQFRNYFFSNNSNFVNAGGGVSILKEFLPFLKKIDPHITPKVIIISLDQYFFNDNWNNKHKFSELDYDKSLNIPPSPISIFLSSYSQIIQDLYNDKIELDKLFKSDKPKPIGMTAIMKSDGFRPDGSYRYKSKITSKEKWSDYQFKDTFKRIEHGTSRFEYGNSVSQSGLNDLDLLLAYCKNKKIYVIGFLPPYAPEIIKKLRDKGSSYEYLWRIDHDVSPIFKKYSYGFFDFTDMSGFDSKDSEFIDGFHGSEVTYAKLFLEMANKDQVLGRVANTKQLEFLISQPASDTILLKDDI